MMDQNSFGVQFPSRPSFFPSFTAVSFLMMVSLFKKKIYIYIFVVFYNSGMNKIAFHQNSFIYRPIPKLAVTLTWSVITCMIYINFLLCVLLPLLQRLELLTLEISF